MAWTEFTLERYERNATRYSSNVTDEEWAVIAPLLPGPIAHIRRMTRLLARD